MQPIEAPGADAIASLTNGQNRDPFAVLGPPPAAHGRGPLVRAFHPAALSIELRLLPAGNLIPMTRRLAAGLFEAVVESPEPRELRALNYRLRLTFPGGQVLEIDDPYRYGRVLTDFDLHLFGEGTHLR